MGAPIVALDLVSPELGWVGTEQGIHRRTEAGGWEQIESGRVADLDFVDATHGWALMNFGLWQTTDGGRHWAPMVNPCGDAGTARLSFTSATEGWLACGGQPGVGMQGKDLHHTTDGGQSWQVIAESGGFGKPPGALPLGGYVSDLYFLDSHHGWISLSRGSVLQTTDGGQTWTGTGGIEVEAATPATLRFFTPTEGLLLLRGGGLQRTADGGRSWLPLYPTVEPQGRLPMQMLSPTHWVTAGRLNDGGAIVWTTDAGRTWHQTGSLGSNIRSLSFLDAENGWALDGEGRVHRTTDGGATWQPLATSPPGGEEQFFRLQFFDQERGYAVSGWGHLYATTDGGQSFTPINREHWTSETKFVTPEIGWRTKEFALYATADGGQSWRPLNLQTRVLDFAITGAESGWVIGGELKDGAHQPLLLHTNDGGQSWTRYDLGSTKPGALRFLDDQRGLMLDQEERLFALQGTAWIEIPEYS